MVTGYKECENVCEFVNEYIRVIKDPYSGTTLVCYAWLEHMIRKFSIDEIIFFDADFIQIGATKEEKLKLKLYFLTHLDRHNFWVIRKYLDESEILAKMKKFTELKGCEDNSHIISMYRMITDYLPNQMYSIPTKVFRINSDLTICLSVPFCENGNPLIVAEFPILIYLHRDKRKNGNSRNSEILTNVNFILAKKYERIGNFHAISSIDGELLLMVKWCDFSLVMERIENVFGGYSFWFKVMGFMPA